MKIYIVKAPEGEYEDYREPIVKVFFDKAKAEEYVKAENDKLPLEQAEKCHECLWRWNISYKDSDKKPQCCKRNKYDLCANYIEYTYIQELFMEEYEVEE